MGSGLAQPNMLNKPVDPMNTQKLKRCTMACNLECFTQAPPPSASDSRELGRAVGGCQSPPQLGRRDLRAPPPRGQGRPTSAAAILRPVSPARSAAARAGAAERCRGRAGWIHELHRCAARPPGAVKLRRFSLELDVQELGGDEIGSEKKIRCGGEKKEVRDSSAMVARV